MKLMYREILGIADISLWQYGDKYIASMTLNDDNNTRRDKTFMDYGEALRCYDDTCNYAAKLYNVTRPLPEMPDFTKGINL